MTTKPMPFKVHLFIPELPKPEGEQLFRCLQARDSGDAINQALKLAFSNAHNPQRLFLIVERLDGNGR